MSNDKTQEIKLHRFSHAAMHTTFTVFISGGDEVYAGSAARDAFGVLDTMESKLSRFIRSSDISCANDLETGDSYMLDSEVWECLMIAADMASRSGRAFDPVAGALIDFWKNRTTPAQDAEDDPEWQAAWQAHSKGELVLDPDRQHAVCVEAGCKLDLGAIGKGFALDKMARVIEGDWDLKRVLLSAGGSTVLALDAPFDKQGWKIGFGGETNLPAVSLVRQALSSSGNHSQPTHLVDPRSGKVVTRDDIVRAIAPTGAVADALSTVFYILSREEIVDYCQQNPGHVALLPNAENSAFDVIGEGEFRVWEKTVAQE